MTTPVNGPGLLAAIRARGCDATDLRDAAHEAHHALTHGIKGKWTRKAVDRAVQKSWPGRRGYPMRLAEEIDARAVEQIVCADLGVECWPVDKAVGIMIMECISVDRVGGLDFDPLVAAVKRRMASPSCRRYADRVIALGAAK